MASLAFALLLALAGPASCWSEDGAQVLLQTVPAKMEGGKEYQATVVMKNTGTTTWTRTEAYRLGSQSPQDNDVWSLGRVELGDKEAVAPGQKKAFSFIIRAPFSGGTVPFQWKMVREHVAWFGEPSPVASIDISPQPPDSLPEKLLMTPYFYWYDSHSQSHILNADKTDALTQHPPSLTDPDFSVQSVEWHKRQLRDMAAAGIDVALPVYWGFPDSRASENWWSNLGLINLSKALEELRDSGLKLPKIGMFYDTTTLEHNPVGRLDLTKKADRELFWGTIRDFWVPIPQEFWARIDGRPVIVLYSASFAGGYDQKAFDYVRERFSRHFGGKAPYFIRNADWRGVETESVTSWGGALKGPQILGTVQIGPGYDDKAVPGRQRSVRSREDGRFYNASWEAAIKSGRSLIIVETWNEFHEGTAIADSKEYGRKYIELTRRWADRWKGSNPSQK